MRIEDIVVGEKLFIHSYKNSDKRHGVNDEMERAVGKFKEVQGIEGDSVRMIGYIWDPKDFSIDIPDPIIDVTVGGETVMFNPEAL